MSRNSKQGLGFTLRVDFTSKFKSIRVCKICVGSGDGKDDGVGFGDVFENHITNLFLDILGLISDRDFCETWKVDKGEGEDVWREDSQVDGHRGDSGILSSLCIC